MGLQALAILPIPFPRAAGALTQSKAKASGASKDQHKQVHDPSSSSRDPPSDKLTDDLQSNSHTSKLTAPVASPHPKRVKAKKTSDKDSTKPIPPKKEKPRDKPTVPSTHSNSTAEPSAKTEDLPIERTPAKACASSRIVPNNTDAKSESGKKKTPPRKKATRPNDTLNTVEEFPKRTRRAPKKTSSRDDSPTSMKGNVTTKGQRSKAKAATAPKAVQKERTDEASKISARPKKKPRFDSANNSSDATIPVPKAPTRTRKNVNAGSDKTKSNVIVPGMKETDHTLEGETTSPNTVQPEPTDPMPMKRASHKKKAQNQLDPPVPNEGSPTAMKRVSRKKRVSRDLDASPPPKKSNKRKEKNDITRDIPSKSHSPSNDKVTAVAKDGHAESTVSNLVESRVSLSPHHNGTNDTDILPDAITSSNPVLPSFGQLILEMSQEPSLQLGRNASFLLSPLRASHPSPEASIPSPNRTESEGEISDDVGPNAQVLDNDEADYSPLEPSFENLACSPVRTPSQTSIIGITH